MIRNGWHLTVVVGELQKEKVASFFFFFSHFTGL